MQEAMHDITDMAFNNSRYHGDEFLLVRFFLHARQNKAKSREFGRPFFEDVPYIEIMQPGNKDSIVKRPATEQDKHRFAEHWKKYQAREDGEHVEGTLLTEWPGISRAQCEDLKYLNIRTVEQLANVNDSNAQNVMGIQMLKQKAIQYLDASKDEATAEALAAANKRIDDLVSLLDSKSDLESVDEDEQKPKRKRRTKAEMAEAAELSQE